MDYSRYLNPVEYPKKPIRPTVPTGTDPEAFRKHAEELEKYNTAMVQYDKDKNVYEHHESVRYENFKKDALEEVQLTGHPAAERAWGLAWDRGHYAGFNEVMCNLYPIAEVVLGDATQPTHTTSPLREKLLQRIYAIKTLHSGFKQDSMRWKLVSFGKTKVPGVKKKPDTYVDTHISNVDFAALDDDKLIEVFEIIIRRMNVQM